MSYGEFARGYETLDEELIRQGADRFDEQVAEWQAWADGLSGLG
jgi:hypothetical protein